MGELILVIQKDALPVLVLGELASECLSRYLFAGGEDNLYSKIAKRRVGEFAVQYLYPLGQTTMIGRAMEGVAVQGEALSRSGRVFVRAVFGKEAGENRLVFERAEFRLAALGEEWASAPMEIEREALKLICEFFDPGRVNSIVSAL